MANFGCHTVIARLTTVKSKYILVHTSISSVNTSHTIANNISNNATNVFANENYHYPCIVT